MDVSMLLLCILAPASCEPAFPYIVTLGFVFSILMLLSVSISLLSLSFISSLMKNILYTWPS